MTTFESLQGMTLVSIEGLKENNDWVKFETIDGQKFNWYPSDGAPNDCIVFISQVDGDINDLLNTPILKAEIKTNQSENLDPEWTWTFFTLATIKGYVDIVWQGQSNGYYSEEPYFEKVDRFHI